MEIVPRLSLVIIPPPITGYSAAGHESAGYVVDEHSGNHGRYGHRRTYELWAEQSTERRTSSGKALLSILRFGATISESRWFMFKDMLYGTFSM